MRSESNLSEKGKNQKQFDVISNSSQRLEVFSWLQIRSLILLSFPAIGQGIIFMSFIFLNVIPSFRCQSQQQLLLIKENFSNDEDYRNFSTEYDQCKSTVYVVNSSDKYSGNQTSAGLLHEERSCLHDLIFDIRNGNTVVSQFGLVCEEAWKRPLTTASFMVGMFFGTVLGGRLADRFGRRLISILTFLGSTILSFAAAFSYYYWLYVFFSLLNGSMSVLTYLTVYTWGLEIAGSPEKRAWASFSFSASFGIGGISISLIAYLGKDWNRILIINGFIFSVFLFLLLFVPESPSWLLQKQRTEGAGKLLKDIVETTYIDKNHNEKNTKIKSLELQHEADSKVDDKPVKVTTIFLWRNRVLRRRLIMVCLLWNIVILSYYTLSLNSANLGGNSYLNNIIGNLLDIAAVAASTIALKRQGRKKTLGFGMVALGCFCIASPLAKKGNEVAGLCLALIGRFFAMAIMMGTFLFSGELFPTMLRNTSICIASALSRSAAIASPFLIFVGKEIDLSIPFYVMGGIALTSIVLILLLPETSKVLLLNTLEDALELKNPRLNSFFGIGRRAKLFQHHKKDSTIMSNAKLTV